MRNTQKFFGGAYKGSGVERDLAERYDSNEDAHGEGENPRVFRCADDIGGDLVPYSIAKHENANRSHCKINDILNR